MKLEKGRTMARISRENSISEKRRMRNERNKRKRHSRTAKKRKDADIQKQKEKAECLRAKKLARLYYAKWGELMQQSKQNKSRNSDKSKVSLFSLMYVIGGHIRFFNEKNQQMN